MENQDPLKLDYGSSLMALYMRYYQYQLLCAQYMTAPAPAPKFDFANLGESIAAESAAKEKALALAQPSTSVRSW